MRDLADNPVFADPEWHDLGRDQARVSFFLMCCCLGGVVFCWGIRGGVLKYVCIYACT